MAFAAKHPGALTAHFLASVFNRLSKGTVSRSSQLRDPSVSAWAQIHSGLTEPRDLKEVLTLGEVLDHVNRREIARAMDTLCKRIRQRGPKEDLGSLGTGQYPEGLTQQLNAGFDQQLKDGVRRSWLRMGALQAEDEGLNAYLLQALAALWIGEGLRGGGWIHVSCQGALQLAGE